MYRKSPRFTNHQSELDKVKNEVRQNSINIRAEVMVLGFNVDELRAKM